MTDALDPGNMVLYDSAVPPLFDGSYKLTVETAVSEGTIGTDVTGGQPASAPAPPPMSQDHYFDVVGPRFNVPASMVAGTFPPKNKAGVFSDALPHIVLSRRSFPWERNIDPAKRLGSPSPTKAPALSGPVPWVALLLFEQGEATVVKNVPLRNVLPPQVFADIGAPSGITCDAVQVTSGILDEVLPSLNELQLLCHVRQINVDNRETQTASGDGFYSVVVANRLPSPGAQCTAVLVSLEGRSDIIAVNPPPVATATATQSRDSGALAARSVAEAGGSAGVGRTAEAATYATTTSIALSQNPIRVAGGSIVPIGFPEEVVWLVALTSWQFTSEGPQTFRYLMEHLDVSMFGTAPVSGHPPLTDTGHLPIALQDRLGATEQVLYRGPLVPYNLTRDTLGPYHSADQARRVTPETGSEDISYAAAFEVGRLLAAADPRLAQALMRWRRESYKQSARQSTIEELSGRIPLNLPATVDEQLHTAVSPAVALSTTQSIAASNLPVADVHGLKDVQSAPGLQAPGLATAWQISSLEATSILGEPGTLGVVAEPPPTSPRTDTTLANVAADTAGLTRLSTARDQVEENATRFLESPGA
jgi:hypothetical protein